MEPDEEPKPSPDDAFAELLRKVARAPPIALGERGDRELVGRTIGHFRVDSHIGSGGMGDVYLATDERLARKVAVKVLPRDVAEDPVRRTLLIREARTAAAITHANVAGVFEVGEYEGRPYIAMEYVDGRTLRTLLSRGPLPAREAYDYALQMARGLASAHRAGIVHRDLMDVNYSCRCAPTIPAGPRQVHVRCRRCN